MSLKHALRYVLVILAFTFIAGVNNADACKIEFKVLGESQEVYKKGDVIVVHVKVTFTHRVCPEGIDKTKFTYEGLKVLGATKWSEKSTGTWERKLKIEITEAGDELKLKAVRTCDKDGGLGSITFKAQ